MEHPHITEARLKYHRVVAKHYGTEYVNEVVSMILVGSTDYCPEVMKAHQICQRKIIYLRKYIP